MSKVLWGSHPKTTGHTVIKICEGTQKQFRARKNAGWGNPQILNAEEWPKLNPARPTW